MNQPDFLQIKKADNIDYQQFMRRLGVLKVIVLFIQTTKDANENVFVLINS